MIYYNQTRLQNPHLEIFFSWFCFQYLKESEHEDRSFAICNMTIIEQW